MSTSNQRKRRRQLHKADVMAAAEGKAIDRMYTVGPVQQSRLNLTYRNGPGLEGLFRSGKKHCPGGTYRQ